MTTTREDAKVKIADFGFAEYSPEDNLKSVCGTPNYIAPEILMRKEYGNFLFNLIMNNF
jgi:serine/threonine protein kinase